MNQLYAFMIALLLSMLIIPMVMRLAVRYGLFDCPDDTRKFHVKAVPRLGGIAIILGFIVSVLMETTIIDNTVAALVISALIILFFGVWDDIKPLNYKVKFIGQFLAICISVIYGGIVVTTIPIYDANPIPTWVAYPLTIVCLLAITNAINLVDGLDGLAGGTSLLSIGVITVLAWLANDTQLVVLSLAVIGGILGFLRFNTHPAQIFMGDSGSQFLGFMMGCLAIILTQKTNTNVSPAIVFFILGLPIIDTLSVMAQRYAEGRSLFSPDRNHIHHKLLDFGIDHYEAVALIYLTQAVFITIAYLGRYESDWLLVLLYLIFCVIALAAFRFSANSNKVQRKKNTNSNHFVKRVLQKVNHSIKINKAIINLLAGLFVIHVLLAIFAVQQISPIVTIAAIVLFFLCLIQYLFSILPNGILERTSYYFLGLYAIFTIEFLQEGNSFLEIFSDYSMVVFAFLVVFGVKFARNREFTITPLDFLIIFIVVTVPNLPGIYAQQLPLTSEINLGEFAIKMLIIFYGVELIFTAFSKNIKWIQLPLMSVLAIVGLFILI